MELLEREGALAALAEARGAAARGRGSCGLRHRASRGSARPRSSPGSCEDLDAGARVLFGTCDDLSIPRPLGPIRDLVGTVSAPLEEALAAGAASHEIQSLLIAELGAAAAADGARARGRALGRRRDARLDHRARAADRLAAGAARAHLPRRRGAAGHPLRAAVGAIRADDSVFLELAPLSERAVASLAGERRGRGVRGDRQATRSTSPSCSPPGRPPSCRPRSRTRSWGARRGSTTTRGGWCSSSRSCPNRVATSVLDAVMPDWPAAAEEPERRQLLEVDPGYVRFRHELARNAIRSSVPIAARRRLHAEILEALLAADADPADIVHHAEAAGAEDVVAEYALVAARRAAALESNREAYSHYRRASAFVDRLPLPSRRPCSRSWRPPPTSSAGSRTPSRAIERAIAIYAELGDEGGRRPLHAGRCRGSTGSPATATLRAAKALEAIAILEPLGASVELARAYSGVSQLAMLAEDAEQALAWGERALRLALRLGDESTRAHALVNLGSARIQLDHRRDRRAPRGARRRRRRRATGTRRRARSATSATSSCAWVQAGAGAPVRAAGARLRRGARGAHVRLVRRHDARLAAAARRRVGRGRAGHARRDRAGHHRRPAAREDGSDRAGRSPGRSGCRRAAGRARGPGRSHRRAAADRAGARAGDRVGADDAARRCRPSGSSSSSPSSSRAAVSPAGSRSGSRLGGRRRDRRRARPAAVRGRTPPCCGATGAAPPTPSARWGGRTTGR